MASVGEQLLRWERSGGHWRVLSRSSTHLTVGLYTCDGGTEMSRLTGSADELEPFLAGRRSSEEPEQRAPAARCAPPGRRGTIGA